MFNVHSRYPLLSFYKEPRANLVPVLVASYLQAKMSGRLFAMDARLVVALKLANSLLGKLQLGM